MALKGNWLLGLHPVFKALTLPRGFGALGCVSLSESLTHSLAPILTSRGLIPPWEGREEGRHLWKEVRWSWPWFLASRAPVLGRKNHIARRENPKIFSDIKSCEVTSFKRDLQRDLFPRVTISIISSPTLQGSKSQMPLKARQES